MCHTMFWWGSNQIQLTPCDQIFKKKSQCMNQAIWSGGTNHSKNKVPNTAKIVSTTSQLCVCGGVL